MSLCPSCVSGAPDQTYFTSNPATNVVVVPSPGAIASNLTMTTGEVPNTSVTHYMTATSGGGLFADHYSAYLYGPSVGGTNIAPIFDSFGVGNGYTLFKCNAGVPLDTTRIGSFSGTGAPVNVPCPSIVSSSVVQCAFVGGPLPAGLPLIVITPGVGFAVTVTNGSAFTYQVFG